LGTMSMDARELVCIAVTGRIEKLNHLSKFSAVARGVYNPKCSPIQNLRSTNQCWVVHKYKQQWIYKRRNKKLAPCDWYLGKWQWTRSLGRLQGCVRRKNEDAATPLHKDKPRVLREMMSLKRKGADFWHRLVLNQYRK
jgi:hypothetical protein